MTKIIILLFFAFLVIVWIGIYFFSWIFGLIRARGVPFVSLSRKQLRMVNENIKLKPIDKVVDLGCGDGRVLRMFEKQGVKDLSGYEVNLWAYLLAKIKNKIFKSKTKIYFKNFRKVNLARYNVIFCYLFDYYMDSLKGKFDRELKPGTKIISFAFQIKNWHKPKIIYTNDKKGRIFVYTCI